MYIPKNKTILTYKGEVKKDIDEPTLRKVGDIIETKRGDTLVIMLNNVHTGDGYGYVLSDNQYKGKFFLLEKELECMFENGEYTVKGQ